MSRIRHRVGRVALSAWLMAAVFVSIAPAATPAEVDAEIQKGVKYLYSQQKDDNWESVRGETVFVTNGQRTGPTALVVAALLSAGEKPATSPKLAAAIEWLKRTDTDGVYALGLRAQVWNMLRYDKDLTVRKAVFRDAKLLLDGAKRDTGGGYRGLYTYQMSNRSNWDSSCSQYGVLGMWSDNRSGAEVPNIYWKAVEAAWIQNQNSSGGWSYNSPGQFDRSSANMTAAGIATLFITQDYLRGMDGIRCNGNAVNEPIDRGMAWMQTNLPTILRTGGLDLYGYYGLERIGVASGYKYFGSLDWYKEGAEQVCHHMPGWEYFGSSTLGTPFAILFLTRGRAPVVMNKLQYTLAEPRREKDGSAHWNQRPRDAANVVRFVSKELERDLNWQIVTLNTDVDQLNEAPILYLAGDQSLQFSQADEAKLRQFVEQGGLILGNADCGSEAFAKSFKALGIKLFPGAGEFRTLGDDHPIYTRQQFAAKNWKTRPEVLGLSNRARELMLLLPAGDPGKAWQMADSTARLEQFQLMSDVFLYSVDQKDLRYKGDTYLVKPERWTTPKRTIYVARLDLGITCDPEPGGWRRLSAVMHNNDGADVEATFFKPTDFTLQYYKIAHLTGSGTISPSDAQLQTIKRFIDRGGTLIIDAVAGDTEFAVSAEQMLQKIWPNEADQLKLAIPSDSPLYSMTEKPIGPTQFRSFARGEVPAGQDSPLLRGITLNGRLAVIFSREDLSAGLVGESIDGIVGYSPATATDLMRCCLLYASSSTKPTTRP